MTESHTNPMSSRRRALLWAAMLGGAVLATPTALMAQAPLGSDIRITSQSGLTMRGAYLGIVSDTLLLLPHGSIDTVRMPVANLKAAEVRRGK